MYWYSVIPVVGQKCTLFFVSKKIEVEIIQRCVIN